MLHHMIKNKSSYLDSWGESFFFFLGIICYIQVFNQISTLGQAKNLVYQIQSILHMLIYDINCKLQIYTVKNRNEKKSLYT